MLDFSRPGILDFSKLPSLPTENASQLYVWSASEAWFTAFNARLSQLFNERRTGFDWLHKPVYDYSCRYLEFRLRFGYVSN